MTLNDNSPDIQRTRRLMAIGLLVQAALVGIWWWRLLVDGKTIDWFQPSSFPDQALLSFWLADAALIVLGSVITAWATVTSRPLAAPGLWVLVGGTTYAALFCLGSSLISGEAWLATTLMVAQAGFNLVLATMFGHHDSPQLSRVSRKTRSAALAWTALQAALFWVFFLVLVPLATREIASRMEWPMFTLPGQVVIGGLLFGVASLLGLWSGWTMALVGLGTPLPTSSAPLLVIAGPYRWVRNPMAVAGIWQGLAIGLAWGDGLMLAVSLGGGLLWHLLVRPWEEQELSQRFGQDYDSYRAQVGLWWPRWRAIPARGGVPGHFPD